MDSNEIMLYFWIIYFRNFSILVIFVALVFSIKRGISVENLREREVYADADWSATEHREQQGYSSVIITNPFIFISKWTDGILHALLCHYIMAMVHWM